jgi:hypothetical protein
VSARRPPDIVRTQWHLGWKQDVVFHRAYKEMTALAQTGVRPRKWLDLAAEVQNSMLLVPLRRGEAKQFRARATL